MVIAMFQNKLLQIWQYNTQAEKTMAEAIQTALDYGFTGIVQKALDGNTWMGNVDPSSDAIHSSNDVARLCNQCNEAGLSFYIWTVPHAVDVDMAQQAIDTAACATACNGVFLDVEPYAGFWGIQPAGIATTFMKALTDQLGGNDLRDPAILITLQPDPRPARIVDIKIAEWLPYVDAVAPQHYWSTFGTTPEQELQNADDLWDQLWAMKEPLQYWLTVPGATDPSLIEGIDLSDSNEPGWPFNGLVVWRLGTATPETLKIYGAQ